MTSAQIKKLILSYQWERWLERPFGTFFLSFFKESLERRVMKKTGVNAQYPLFFFERGAWYINRKSLAPFHQELEDYLKKGGSIFKITASCQKFYRQSKKQINDLLKNKRDTVWKATKIKDILSLSTSYVWLAHGLDDYYSKKLHQEVPKYITGDIERFIGDMSFPSKKTAYEIMKDAIRKGEKAELIVKKFGWIKARDGFADGFTKEEIKQLRKELIKNKKLNEYKKIKIPKSLLRLAKETQELVYFRTFRTDVLYELLYMARPIFSELARKYGLTYQELKNYSLFDLLAGKIKKYPDEISCACYKGQLFYFDKPLLPLRSIGNQLIKGTIAFKGIVRGTVKIVRRVEELLKVKQGDILVTQMTFPSFIMAMERAVAFVTDEGGITCHAAIVAREMRKPCIIGTKIATKVLKDGDWVEVDAEKGIVKIIK